MNYRLVDAMRECGMTDEELARRLGVNRKSVLRYRHGTQPRVRHAIRIARILGASVYDLWEESNDSVYKEEQL